MGELEDYYIVLSEVKYNDDPMKFGRLKCDIPGVIHASTSTEEAMPWVRPFNMHGYQTFSKPIVGQKIFVLISKTNYNEYWWFPFHETTDLVQDYLNANYDNQPDVFNAREGSGGDAIFTYDDNNGYMMRIGDDHLNLKPDHSMEISFNECKVKIDGNKVYCGSDNDSYEPCVMGHKCRDMRKELSNQFKLLSEAAGSSPYTMHLKGGLANISEQFKTDILGSWLNVN